MKIKVLHRDPQRYSSVACGHKAAKHYCNSSQINPLQHIREYQRAIQAAKIERIFAKPFVHQFHGHLDTVKSLARCNRNVFDFFSGGCDGELRFWSLSEKRCVRVVSHAHNGFVEGICVARNDKYVFTCGNDSNIKQWAVEKHFKVGAVDQHRVEYGGNLVEDSSAVHSALNATVTPVNVFIADSGLSGLDHNDERDYIASAGTVISIWDVNRTQALTKLSWDKDPHTFVRWSPSETNLLIAGSINNGVVLYDDREGDAVQRLQLQMRPNAGVWNPMRPFDFSVACDDTNIYTFDIRKFDSARCIHFGFVHAALDVDYSPTGQELVGSSFDATVRIWRNNERKAREVYSNNRMQAITSCRYTGDSKFILTGSADFSVRVWKTNSSERLEAINSRERKVLQYRDALKLKFKEMPEVKQILEKRHLPIKIKNKIKQRTIAEKAQGRKRENRINNKNPLEDDLKPLRQKVIRNIAYEDLSTTHNDLPRHIEEEKSTSESEIDAE